MNGVLDLSAWDLDANGTVHLDGEWEFYWAQLLTPQDFERHGALREPSGGTLPPPTGWIAVPGAWSGVRFGGEPLPRDGYATYRLRIRLRDRDGLKAIFIRYVCSSYRLWVDDSLVASSGVVGTSRTASSPRYVPNVAYFTPRSDTVQLVLQVANFHHRCNGIWSSPELGAADQIIRERQRNLSLEMFFFGAILVMALYHLVLYLLRRTDRLPLHFGLFCLIIGIRVPVTGEELLVRMVPGFNWAAELRIEYLTDYLGLPVFLLFLRSLYPEETAEKAVRLAWAVSLAGAGSLLAPVRVHSLFIPPYEVVLGLFIAYQLSVLVRAFIRRRDGAGLFLAGGGVFLGTLVNDLLSYNLILPTVEVLPLGLFVLILAQSVVLAGRFAHAFSELQRSRRMLTEREENLRREIAEMLHGRVQTRLLMAGHRIGQAERVWDADPCAARALVAAARGDIETVREEDVRQASHLLHPSIIRVGLVPAVRSLAGRFEDHFRVAIEADPRLVALDDSVDNRIPEPVRLAAYRVLEEALGNVYAHAGASRAEIYLGLSPERRLHLRVRDDGRGVDTARLRPGLGLCSIAARVGELGGGWEIAGRPGRGTTLSVWIPLVPVD